MTKVLHAGGLWIRVESGLRVGAGETGGAVDLTVARETHTGWPFIPAPTIKGALRARLESSRDTSRLVKLLFGSPEQGGLVSCGDARIAALTVRSLAGVMAWVTCPSVVQRVARDLMLSGLPTPGHVEPLSGGMALCRERSPLLTEGSLLLEGFAFKRAGDLPPGVPDLVQPVSDSFGQGFDASDRLAIVSDRLFGFFVRHALPAVARVALEYETKTAKGSALFSQESVPPDTIFCSTIRCHAGTNRRNGGDPSDDGSPTWRRSLDGVVQIGAGASTGVGICELTARWSGEQQR